MLSIKQQIKIVNILRFFGIKCSKWRKALAEQIITNIEQQIKEN